MGLIGDHQEGGYYILDCHHHYQEGHRPFRRHPPKFSPGTPPECWTRTEIKRLTRQSGWCGRPNPYSKQPNTAVKGKTEVKAQIENLVFDIFSITVLAKECIDLSNFHFKIEVIKLAWLSWTNLNCGLGGRRTDTGWAVSLSECRERLWGPGAAWAGRQSRVCR